MAVDEEGALSRKIGARITDRRIALGIPRDKFASMIGIADEKLASIEAGLTSVGSNQLATIAEALDIKLIDLFT